MPFVVRMEVGGTVEVFGDSFEMTKMSNLEYAPGSLLIYEGETMVKHFVAAEWHGIAKPSGGPDGKVPGVQAIVLG